MAQNKLTKCPDCQGTVSKKADKCPHCGAKLKDSSVDSFVNLVFFIVIIVIILIFFSTIKII